MFLSICETGEEISVISTQLSYSVNSLTYLKLEDNNLLSLGCEDGFIRILSIDKKLELISEIKAH